MLSMYPTKRAISDGSRTFDWGNLVNEVCLALVNANAALQIHLTQFSQPLIISRIYRVIDDSSAQNAIFEIISLSKDSKSEMLDRAKELKASLVACSGVNTITKSCDVDNVLVKAELKELTALAATFICNDGIDDILICIYSTECNGDDEALESKINVFFEFVGNFLSKDNRALNFICSIFLPLEIPFAIVSRESMVQYVDKNYETIFGYSLHDLVGKSIKDIRSWRHSKEYYDNIWATAEESGCWSGSVWQRKKSGELFLTSQTVFYIGREFLNEKHYCIVYQRINSLSNAPESEIDSNLDPLTRLLNRDSFLAAVNVRVKSSRTDKLKYSILLINLVNFSDVNESYGNVVGDLVLVEVAKIINSRARDSDLVSRIHGDEFSIFFESEDVGRSAEALSSDLERVLSKPIIISRKEVFIAVNIGISIYPEDGRAANTLMNRATQALKTCKKTQFFNHAFYDDALQRVSKRRAFLKAELIKALKLDLIEPFFQPIVEAKTRKIVKVEVLCRWRHDVEGFISPAEFIPVAQQFQLMGNVGAVVFRKTLNVMRKLNNLGCILESYAVNKSIPEFVDVQMATAWISEIKACGIDPRQMVIEITEDTFMENQDLIGESLSVLKAGGVGIAIDDFGTGYSSLSYLIKNPVDIIKIDRVFVSSLHEKNSLTLIKSIISLAHDLNMTVVAEGVETEPQLRHLLELGCDYIQGFYCYKPMSADDLEALCTKSIIP